MGKMSAVVDAMEQLSQEGRKLRERVDSFIAKKDAIDPAKVRALYERAGTPGEKAAALAALKRMGFDPEKEEKTTRQKDPEKSNTNKSVDKIPNSPCGWPLPQPPQKQKAGGIKRVMSNK